ncbi:putative zeta-coat protein [Conidiobolus coronatus NRRL 28638]|uniref:Coatomer subunit zeta n=1 Tax=Conidiobolus coronatus (strain ATCC 28846 / CBS 209.66 / NRRL 28638) TaxID=796925 RepID=A0A137P8Y4_CONC2|nr:putative zeta-coat protein [Conidiobolus coronatus NRRL 28638]|eukprot:KXN71414.1 putative zeta-coat protein [Conidiobolus coronatus NRRL 28638]
MSNLSLYSINAVLILDSEGQRILTKYYTRNPNSYVTKAYPTVKEQKKFERGLFEKTSRGKGTEIILYDGNVIVYKSTPELFVYFVGTVEENEIMLQAALTGFYEALSTLVKHQLDKRAILETIDCVAIALDECIDDGIILEVDSEKILSRVSKRTLELSEMPLNEQTLSFAYKSLKEKVASSLMS